MTDLSVLEIKPHPDADHVPSLTPDEYDELYADIVRRGIQVPVDVTTDGTILDGRTRHGIAIALGLSTIPVRVVDPADPYEYMLLAALRRRHLTPSQVGALTLDLPTYQRAKHEAEERQRSGKRNLSATRREGRKAVEAIAEGLPVSARSLERAERIDRERPDLRPKVASGELTLTEAERVVARGKAQEQRQAEDRIIASDPDLSRGFEVDRLNRVLTAAMRVNTEATAAYWLEYLTADDIDTVRSVIGSLRRWIESWETAFVRSSRCVSLEVGSEPDHRAVGHRAMVARCQVRPTQGRRDRGP